MPFNCPICGNTLSAPRWMYFGNYGTQVAIQCDQGHEPYKMPVIVAATFRPAEPTVED